MQHYIPKKIGCTHACLTAILAINIPPAARKTPLSYTPGIAGEARLPEASNVESDHPQK